MARLNTEEIRNTLSDIPQETLADALAIFLSDDNTETGPATHTHPEFQNFSQVISYLKKNYSFEELDKFTTEADLVYVHTSDRRILLTNRDTPVIRSTPPRELAGEAQSETPSHPGENQPESGNDGNSRFSRLEF